MTSYRDQLYCIVTIIFNASQFKLGALVVNPLSVVFEILQPLVRPSQVHDFL